MQSKKAQGAIEFMIILIFIFTIIAIFMYYSGDYLVDLKNQEQQKFAKNYADKINNELQILSKVEPGYKRELVLRNQDYNVSIINSLIDGSPTMLKLVDIYDNETYYFDLVGNYNLDVGNLEINVNRRPDVEFNFNVTVLTFIKNPKKEVSGIDLLVN